MTNAIQAEGLTKTFGGKVRVTALDDLSLSVEAGTIFGLLGPNGAGKTTAVRIFTTTLVPDGGNAQVLGYDVVTHAREVRQSIGLAGQFAAVDENLTGRENLRMIGQLNHLSRRQATERANQLLVDFGLSGAASRPARGYSGGMRRRLDLAAALVRRPPVLFLDEPTTGLDPQSRVGLWGVIEELVGEGTTVLLTTQYLEEADRLAGKVAVVDQGRVIAEGTPAKLKAELGATMLSIALPDQSGADRAAQVLGAIWDKAPVVEGATVEVSLDGGPSLVSHALAALDQAGLEAVTLSLREPSLDDVFLALTGHRTETQPNAEAGVQDGPASPERSVAHQEVLR